MNGKQMLKAMSFVDEKYIEDAEAAPSETAFTGRASPPRPVWQLCWQGFGV